MKPASLSQRPSVSLSLPEPPRTKLVVQPELVETARSLADASVSANTRRAYEGALRRLALWLWEHAVPLNDESLAAYIASVAAAGHAPPSAAMAVAAVKFRARLTGKPSPVGVLTSQQLAGFRREHSGRGVGQVAGISWRVADAVASIAERSDPSARGARDAAIISVASDALLRVSEVAALQVSDVEAEAPNTLTIRRSKTDQEATGSVAFLGDTTILRVRRYLEITGIETGFLFRGLTRSGQVLKSLSDRSIRQIIKDRAAAIDSIPGRVSGHSLRVGAAQSLAAAGASIADMQAAGRWKSQAMPGYYSRGQLATRNAVARLRYGR
ncbi:MAG: tyrosine-type recombinase/integrase [Rhodobacteraceae bacterium]|nr:tyrosine-type recombinase/integrase [Paracoccaceae bacterium]